ncbi:hypothetical protein DL766_003082 [Monosporascus sp. MC13-8B]|uniref:Uncharacterized protein n=1 Tax=Monosporascus cannonballus TaxID=155416 RepID=A0ABY0GRA3_9PEZI|nr:hypothetical protein DL762_010155 [Monosporascus cannonballus]RYO76650.1 hypothetical protein DL763_010275 [Monosporascus cannonballus]RYP34265.1 hypothetical protein DL766_003082 [Monosporascus sp. MC13-8B]
MQRWNAQIRNLQALHPIYAEIWVHNPQLAPRRRLARPERVSNGAHALARQLLDGGVVFGGVDEVPHNPKRRAAAYQGGKRGRAEATPPR